MSTTISQVQLYQQLNSCRVVSVANLAGSYTPGLNGVGGLLEGSGVLTIDGVAVQAGDRVLLPAQTSTAQNGIWVVRVASPNWVLERAPDLQSAEQVKEGQYLSIGDGTNKGSIYVIVQPLPQVFGVSALNFFGVVSSGNLGTAAYKNASDNTKAIVSSINLPTVPFNLIQADDNQGTIGDSGIGVGNVIQRGFLLSGKIEVPAAVANYTVTIPGITTSSIVIANLANVTNPGVFLEQISPGVPADNQVSFVINLAPGGATFLFYYIATVGPIA